jgi:hypothetical protein
MSSATQQTTPSRSEACPRCETGHMVQRVRQMPPLAACIFILLILLIVDIYLGPRLLVMYLGMHSLFIYFYGSVGLFALLLAITFRERHREVCDSCGHMRFR